MEPVSALAPHWLDKIIEKALEKGEDPAMIAAAISTSPKFMDAIREGLKNKPKPGTKSGTYAQNIRTKVVQTVESPS
jgi:hypothetical protein